MFCQNLSSGLSASRELVAQLAERLDVEDA